MKVKRSKRKRNIAKMVQWFKRKSAVFVVGIIITFLAVITFGYIKGIYRINNKENVSQSSTSEANVSLVSSNEIKWVLTQYQDKTDIQAMFYTLKCTDGTLIVIDGGNLENSEYVRQIILENGGHVNAWILTHPHSDHIDAFCEIYKEPKGIVIDKIYDDNVNYNIYKSVAGEIDHIETYEKYLALTKGDTRITHLNRGDDLNIDGLRVQVFNACDDITQKYGEDYCNDSSLMFRVSTNYSSVLFCSDVSANMQECILSRYENQLKSDYVQMGHHGNTSLNMNFYNCVCPEGAFFDAPAWLIEGEKYTTQSYIQIMKDRYVKVYLWKDAPNSVDM